MFFYKEIDDFKETMYHYFGRSIRAEDLAFVKDIIYNNSWCSAEESAGLCVFRAIDDNLYIVEYGYCVMTKNNQLYNPQEISEELAVEKMLAMEADIINHNAIAV